MRQVECPDCGAPMWEGGRCPWDFGKGCVGRELSKARPTRRQHVSRERVARVRAAVPRRHGPRARQATCHPERRHLAKGLCRSCYEHDWRDRHPGRSQKYRPGEYERRRDRRRIASETD